MMKRIALLALVCCLTSAASASEIEDTIVLAEQGYDKAQYNLALMHYDGKGVPQDHAEAVKWFSKAAEQGYDKAQYNLALMYYDGKGVPQNHAEAVKWFHKAAEQGHDKAQYDLALMYGKGEGVPQNYVEAYAWSNLAAASGYANGIKARDIIANALSPADLDAAQKRAAKLSEEIQ
mgnify:CR=1 FL=1